MSKQCAIGIDVGGTKCAAGLVSLADGGVLARRLQPTGAPRGGAAVLAEVIDLARSLRDEATQLGASPTAIGVGVAELVGIDGRVLSDATIGWKGVAIAEAIFEATGLTARVEADVRAAARAEAEFGAGRGQPSFLYVTVGTGISSCLVVAGVPYAGARGLTGTCASSRGLIPGDDGQLVGGPPLEQFAAGPAIAARFAAATQGEQLTTAEIIARSEAGDALAAANVESAATALGAAIGQLVNVLDPHSVILGGGLGMVEGHYRAWVDRALRSHIWSELHLDLPLVSAELGVDAGLVGAALAAATP